MRKYLIPSIPMAHVPGLILFCVLGCLIAGTYGVIHDQVTYSIGPEYFTQFKYEQFRWANFGWSDRFFVGCIGFLATWWVGLIVAWILTRRMLPNQSFSVAAKKILAGFGVVFLTGFATGAIGYGYGLYLGPEADYSRYDKVFKAMGVTDAWAFLRVAYIHNAGYLGGLIGLVLTFFLIRPGEESDAELPNSEA